MGLMASLMGVAAFLLFRHGRRSDNPRPGGLRSVSPEESLEESRSGGPDTREEWWSLSPAMANERIISGVQEENHGKHR